MGSPYVDLPTRYGRGLNLVDAPDALGEGEARRLANLRITGRGWLTSRKAAVELSTPGPGDVVAVVPYDHTGSVGGVLLVWDSVAQHVELWTVNGSGGGAVQVGVLPGYTGIAQRPELSTAALARCVFISDVTKTDDLVVYDPNDVLGSGSSLFRPTFDFDGNLAFAAATPRLVVEHLNHLWMFGYNDEGDPDRGEAGRFSYLGLTADAQGSGDAGDGGAAGSESLFDVEDLVPVGPRGEAVVSAASGNGRLLVCTERRAAVIYGSDRLTWSLDPVDNQRGSVATRGMIEADGLIYWLSPLGPCRYRGGAVVEDLSRQIDPLLEEIDFGSVFAAQNPAENQVRWYYRRRDDTTAGADRWIGWDYLHDAFVADTLPSFRVFSAGTLRPSGAEGPVAAPSALTHPVIGVTHGTAKWENGDTSPGTRTRVWRAVDDEGVPGDYSLMDVLDSGVGQYVQRGLAADTTYWTKLEHLRNGQVSASIEADFTTNTPGPPPPVTEVLATDSPVLSSGTWQPSVLVSWEHAWDEAGLTFHLERNVAGAGYVEIHETAGSSYRDSDVDEGVSVQYRVRVENPFGDLSTYVTSLAVTPTTDDPYAEWPDVE